MLREVRLVSSKDDINEPEKTLEEEVDNISLTESVEKLKKKTIKSMKKWNDENFLYASRLILYPWRPVDIHSSLL